MTHCIRCEYGVCKGIIATPKGYEPYLWCIHSQAPEHPSNLLKWDECPDWCPLKKEPNP